jgi:hypothetical protein
MWGVSDPARLLKKKWSSTYELALELWSMATGAEEIVADKTVRMQAQRGKPALVIEQGESYSPAAGRQAGDARKAEANERTYARVPQNTSGRQDAPSTFARTERAIGSAIGSAANAVSEQIEKMIFSEAVVKPIEKMAMHATDGLFVNRKQEEPSPSVPDEAVAERSQSAQRSSVRPEAEQFQAEFRTQDKSKRELSSPSASAIRASTQGQIKDAEPHRNPVAEITGPVSFRGADPVQFDTPPQVLNPTTQKFEPLESRPQTKFPWYALNSKLVWIDTPGITASTGRTGVAGTGTAQFIDFDPDGKAFKDNDYQDTPVFSLMQFPMAYCWASAMLYGDTWFVIPIAGTLLASTRAGGIPAASGSQPGTATCDLLANVAGSYVSIGSATVRSDMTGGVVGAAGGVRVVCGIDSDGGLRALNEDCVTP